MNFLLNIFKRKKVEATKGEEKDRTMNDETRRLYYASEFKSFGDMTKDGLMSIEEFYRLMMLLGYPNGKDGARRLWKSQGQPDGGKMNQKQYISMMFDPEVDAQTSMWRKLFFAIDTDGSGFGTKTEVIKGLEKMGLKDSPALKDKVDKMDTNHDGKIAYAEFLKAQLHQ